ncbi:MAG TPA: helix-hairpin-helix domain-containing protein, partial [Kofleriaceae bacterium]|nr:helix-hairpin-helix domain-containing protein [Kofleriaceae bacterium]
MDAVTIAATLRELAVYLRLEGDGYRAKAYETAARTLEAIHDLERRVADETLTELPGVGTSIAAAVKELLERGSLRALERLREKWPRTIVELAQLPGLGLKKARVLVERLAPADLDELTAMVEAGRAREVPGFGPASEAKLLAALRERHQRGDGPMVLVDARQASRTLAEYLAASRDAAAVHVAGPTRRWIELVDELVLVVATGAPDAIRDHLRRYPLVLEAVPVPEAPGGGGLSTIAFRLARGERGRVVLAPPARVGAALVVA